VTLGGRRVPVRRPRVRTADGTAEVAVPAYDLTELLGEMALQRMMARLSTRRYSAGLEPVGSQVEATARSTSKSAVSRRFVAATESTLATMLAADLSGLDLVALMIDGVHFAGPRNRRDPPTDIGDRSRRQPHRVRPVATPATLTECLRWIGCSKHRLRPSRSRVGSPG
jgi:hypothetical protein